MCRLMQNLCRLLQVKHLHTSVYHQQTNSLVEKFNQTFEEYSYQIIEQEDHKWDLLLSYILFAVQKTSQALMGFTAFKLLYEKRPSCFWT